MGNKTKNKFSKWLEDLQQESWQLELIISGFSIFLLLGAYESISNLEFQIRLLATGDRIYSMLHIPYSILLGSWYVLVFNLILHVLLRGLWISTIGLRYVSGDIDFKELEFSPKFEQHLKRRIVSFDTYIERLEKICSVVFAFTFLIVFILISGGLAILALISLGLIVDWINHDIGDIGVFIFLPIVFLFLFFGLIYFIDFITLGWIKRRKKFAKLYYPFYRFYSLLTLAFIYRPIYYNLIDNKFGRRVGLLLIPYLIVFVVGSSLTVRSHAFLPSHRAKQSFHNIHYEDTSEENRLSYQASIPSKFVKDDFLPLYLPYNPENDDKAIQLLCPDLKPAKTGTGFEGFFLQTWDWNRDIMNADSALLCSAQRLQIYLNDSLLSNAKYRFYEHPIRQNIGLLTILDIKHLPRGEQILRVDAKVPEHTNVWSEVDSLITVEAAHIPFWKE